MPMNSPLAKLRTVEFFGVLLPGLVVVGSLALAYVSAHSPSDKVLARSIAEHFKSDPKWYPATVIIVIGYLLGSVIRAFPISTIDRVLARLVWPLIRVKCLTRIFGTRFRLLYAESFPYRPMLRAFRVDLAYSGSLGSREAIPSVIRKRRDPHHNADFSYWKTYVTMRNAGLAVCVQEAEARTRMFFGLLWATLFAFAAFALAAHLSHLYIPRVCGWVALLCFLAFSLRLRHVRGEEARQVYCAFIAQRVSDVAEMTKSHESKEHPASEPSNSGVRLAGLHD